MKPEYETAVVARLRTARGQLDGIVRMVEAGDYCPEVMKQLAAVQGMLEAATRTVLRNHLETCVATAAREGRIEQIVDELMQTLKYEKHALRPTLTAADVQGAADVEEVTHP